MASRGQPLTLSVYAYDTGASAPKTGDAANITLKIRRDGVAANPTNAVTEDDPTNEPGWYSVSLTSAECTCNVIRLAGKSSTEGVVVTGTQVTFEQLPTVAPGASNGLFIAGTNAATTVTTSFTTTFAGNLSGSVGSVAGAVASVTGNVGGNVVGSVGSLTGYVAPDNATITAIAGYLDTEVAAIKAKTDNLPASPAAVGSAMTLSLSQTGLSPRDLGAVADGSLTVGDALVAAIAGAAGKQTVASTSYVVKTPSTGTVIRTFTLDSATVPTSRA